MNYFVIFINPFIYERKFQGKFVGGESSELPVPPAGHSTALQIPLRSQGNSFTGFPGSSDGSAREGAASQLAGGVDGSTQFLAAVTLSALLHGQLLLRRQESASTTKAFFGNILTKVTAFLLVILLVGSESQVLLRRALM